MACLALAAFVACGPRRAEEALRGKVLFYPWSHGASLSGDPERVAAIRSRKNRSLLEVEDFVGTLPEWTTRTVPVERIRIGPEDFVLDKNIFFHYLAALADPAVGDQLRVRISRLGPDGTERVDLTTTESARIQRRVQSGGMLYSMAGLSPGDHRLRFELLDGERVAASGDLWVEYHPGPPERFAPEAHPPPPTTR